MSKLEAFVKNTKLLVVEPTDKNGLKYSNFVITVKIIPPGYSLALESIISYYHGGFIKCGMRRFCGLIFRLKDSIGMTTHVVFRSGKMNTVGAKSIEHARNGAHRVRLLIGRIKGAYKRNGKIVLSDIIQQTTFLDFRVELMVASITLKKRPNLKHLYSVAPDLSKWSPDMFPGLRFLVWVRPQSQCKCKKSSQKKHKSNNCKCTATVIMFDTGKMNITGCKRICDVNCAVKLIEVLFASDDEFICNDPLLPSHLRNKARKQLLNAQSIQYQGVSETKRTKPVQSREFNVFDLLPKRKKIKG